jgi:GTP-binding protein
MRQGWKTMVEQYLESRVQLKLLVLILDPRRGLESQELEFIDWLGQMDIPVLLAMTKVDKLKRNDRAIAAAGIMSRIHEPEADLIEFSSATCEGREAMWNYFQALLGPLDFSGS